MKVAPRLSRFIAAPCVALAWLAAAGIAHAVPPALATHAERSGFLETGRYAEAIGLCDAFAARYPAAVRCETFGTTPEQRPMKLLVVSTAGAFTPEAARERGLPVTLLQGGIHAGEIDGKDAGFLALRQLLDGEVAPGVLDRQVVLFVPVFNVDGHERFRAWNRPNQRGPREMGWRTTARNHNLNRDYLKADAPEMHAMLGVLRRWDPLAYIDLHVTDGAQFEHDISIQVEPLNSGDAPMREAGRALRDGTIARLARAGFQPLPFYPSFVVGDDPSSGFRDGVAPPRFSHGYMPLRNRLGMLVETHSWRDYPHRVRATREAILAVLDLVAAHGAGWQATARGADARAAALAGQPMPLDYAADTDACRLIDYKGYAYTRTPSDVSGATMTRYDETTPQTWRIPLCDAVSPGRVVQAPGAGYIVPAAHAGLVAAKLDLHGIAYRRLDRALAGIPVRAFRATSTSFATVPSEGHQRLALEGDWRQERQDLRPGSLFVPVDQPLARVVVALLEPQAPDSLAAWGWFNNHFERKEYMEPYVAEAVAREMLADDPALRAEFARRLEDPVFAADPAARLDFFYRRHASWDDAMDRYPVVRVDAPPR